MSQLAFTWQETASYAPEDFIVSDSNVVAVRFLETWPDGHAGVALLSGAHACGKTHLARRWLDRVNGVALDRALLGMEPSEALWPAKAPALLEDIDTLQDEAALFHLLRHAESVRQGLLLTSAVPARQLPFTLPDLCSRLIAMPVASIETPDDGLLRMFIVKCFSDRQLRISGEVAEYILNRVERSFASVREVVEKLERASLETRREITVPLVKRIV
jgi:chromosomal replication initiation ATPase DnaA